MQIKYTTLFLLLAGTTVFSQIKTSKNITVDVRSNAFLDASENIGGNANVGRGLLFPHTDLSTFKLNKSAADGINYPTYFDGMIVYNTHEGGSTTDSNIQTTENLEKGFYYFSNPTGKNTQSIANGKWIKISDAQANADLGLWKHSGSGVTPIITDQNDSGPREYIFDKYVFTPSLRNGKYLASYDIGYARHVGEQVTNPKYGNSFNMSSVTENGELLSAGSLNSDGSIELFRGEQTNSKHILGYVDFRGESNRDYDVRLMAVDYTKDGKTNNPGATKGFRFYSDVVDDQNTEGLNFNYEFSNVFSKFKNKNTHFYLTADKGLDYNLVNNEVNLSTVGVYPFVKLQTRTGRGVSGNRHFLTISTNRFLESNLDGWNGTTLRLQKTVDNSPMGFVDFGISGVLNDTSGTNGLGFGFNNSVYAVIRQDGKMGIGTITPTEKLEVVGKVKATAFMGTNGASIFPDYVFENYYTGTSTTKADYSFKNLDQVEDFVKTNGHLPGYVSAKEIKAQGYIDIMDTQLTNVEKIEELYLHTIAQEKKIQQQSQEIEELKALVKELLNK